MTRSAALLLVVAAVALSAASARVAPDHVIASEGQPVRQLLGKQACKEKDGCTWCPDEDGKKEHDDDYECQPAEYILGKVLGGLGGLLGGGSHHKWCRHKEPKEPKCNDGWFYSDSKKDNCKCERKSKGYCCYEEPEPDCKDMDGDYDWFYSPKPADNCKCERKSKGYCCYRPPPPPPSCRKLYGSRYSADKKGTRPGRKCKPDAKKIAYCCKKVQLPKPHCIKHWYYGKYRNFCEDSKQDKNKFCAVFKIGGRKIRCCAKKEKDDYDDDKCFFKSVNKKMRKCCYDSSRKRKNNRDYSCFRSEHKGKHGNFCFNKHHAY